MSTTDAAAEAAAEVVQKAAKPLGFIAAVVAGALGVAVIVRKYGASLPLPAYLVDWATGDDEQDEEEE